MTDRIGADGRARRVLVFGATGQQGGAVARALRAAGWSVSALVCDPSGAPARALESIGVETVRGDLSDAAAIRAAMQGVHGVFSVQPSSGQGTVHGVTDAQEIGWGRQIADLAREAEVQHLIYSSVNAVDDIGRIVAAIFARHASFVGQTIEISGDQLSGAGMAEALGRAAGRPIRYGRFPTRFWRRTPSRAVWPV